MKSNSVERQYLSSAAAAAASLHHQGSKCLHGVHTRQIMYHQVISTRLYRIQVASYRLQYAALENMQFFSATLCARERAGATVTLSSGEEIRGAVVVGADGVRSAVGASMGCQPPNYAGYSAYRSTNCRTDAPGLFFCTWPVSMLAAPPVIVLKRRAVLCWLRSSGTWYHVWPILTANTVADRGLATFNDGLPLPLNTIRQVT